MHTLILGFQEETDIVCDSAVAIVLINAPPATNYCNTQTLQKAFGQTRRRGNLFSTYILCQSQHFQQMVATMYYVSTQL